MTVSTRGRQADNRAASVKRGREQGAGRSLPLGPGDVDGSETILRTVEPLEELAHQVELMRAHPELAVVSGACVITDAMGEAGTAAGTYIGMIHANTQAIVTALGGTPVALPDELVAWTSRWKISG